MVEMQKCEDKKKEKKEVFVGRIILGEGRLGYKKGNKQLIPIKM